MGLFFMPFLYKILEIHKNSHDIPHNLEPIVNRGHYSLIFYGSENDCRKINATARRSHTIIAVRWGRNSRKRTPDHSSGYSLIWDTEKEVKSFDSIPYLPGIIGFILRRGHGKEI